MLRITYLISIVSFLSTVCIQYPLLNSGFKKTHEDYCDNEQKDGTSSDPNDYGKWYAPKLDPSKTGSHYVDWSYLLDAPAGKHGFALAKSGKIEFEDGTPARFFGTNFIAGDCFPEKPTSDSLAARLSKMGVNLVRFHHMDAPWAKPNIFGNTGSTRKLSKNSLESLDYLIFSLKRRGIYVYLDLLVHRDFSLMDGIENTPKELGGKQVAFFDPQLIQLQKEFIAQLLNHVNPYTKTAYKNEKAIVGSEFINESSVFVHFEGDVLTEYYRKELNKKFEKEFPGKKMAVFQLQYNARGIAKVLQKTGDEGDVAETITFLSKLEKDYFSDMYHYLKKELGVKYLLSGSNFPAPNLVDQKNNMELDLVLANDYWDHPQVWRLNNGWSKVLYAPINNTSMLKNPKHNIIAKISKYKWVNKPFLITEYNACYPNEYRLEEAPFVAAYSSLQGYSGLLQFYFDPLAPGGDRLSSMTLSRNLDQLAQWVVAAPMYLRNDIKEAPGLVAETITEKALSTLPMYSEFLDDHFSLPYITKVGKIYEEKAENNASAYDGYFDKNSRTIASETGELQLDYKKGIFTVNSPRVQGAVGALSDSVIDLPLFRLQAENPWISIMAISKDSTDLKNADKFYLVVTTPLKMSGQKMDNSRKALVDIGETPMLAQIAEGEIIFNISGKQIQLVEINAMGERMKTFKIKEKENRFRFDLSQGRTFVYEVIIN